MFYSMVWWYSRASKQHPLMWVLDVPGQGVASLGPHIGTDMAH